MENKICLDSDFLIDILRNKKEAFEWLEKNEDKDLCTTSINIFELFYGAYKKNKSEIEACNFLLQNFLILNLSADSAKLAGKIACKLDSLGQKIDYKDIFIASISIQENMSLKTSNKRHFERIEGLKLV